MACSECKTLQTHHTAMGSVNISEAQLKALPCGKTGDASPRVSLQSVVTQTGSVFWG